LEGHGISGEIKRKENEFFDYRMKYDDDGRPTPVVWNTKAMKVAWIRFGQLCSIYFRFGRYRPVYNTLIEKTTRYIKLLDETSSVSVSLVFSKHGNRAVSYG
jgi:hypothetical protein